VVGFGKDKFTGNKEEILNSNEKYFRKEDDTTETKGSLGLFYPFRWDC
jgi:hypothetical protein